MNLFASCLVAFACATPAFADVASTGDLRMPTYNCTLSRLDQQGHVTEQREKLVIAPDAATAVAWLQLLADQDLLKMPANDIVCGVR